MSAEIQARIVALREDLAATLLRLGRPVDAVELCAVTKRHPREAVEAAIAAGVTSIGESYVQEAVPKLVGLPPVTKHFIGHIQTNKAKSIVAAFDVIQSVDRLEAGVALAKAMQSLGRGVRILVQVNISPTERFGVPPQESAGLARALRQLDLKVDGVMAIAPFSLDRQVTSRSFEEAARCFAEIGGSTFSIGMSGDWHEAVAHGSTMIRIGTAIFGPRGT